MTALPAIAPGTEIDLFDERIELWVRVCAFIETLQLTRGSLRGQRIKLLPFQIDFIKRICDPRFNVCCMSVPRGNGKTTLLAAIFAAALVGPLMVHNTEIPVVAKDKSQALKTVVQADEFLMPWRKENGGPITYRANGNDGLLLRNMLANIECTNVATDPKRMHGSAFALAGGDEMAQWPKNTGEKTWNAMRGSLGKEAHSRVVGISTMPDDEHHFYSRAVKAGQTPEGNELGIYAVKYAADPNAQWDDLTAYEQANPVWHHIKSLRDTVKKEIQMAKIGEASPNYLKAYRLNMGVHETDDVEYLLNPDPIDTWNLCVVKNLDKEAPAKGDWILTFDIGGSSSMTAASAYWIETGRYQTWGAFGGLKSGSMKENTLEDRERVDKVDNGTYRAAEKNGELRVFPGKVTPVGPFIKWIQELTADYGDPITIIADRYKQADVEQAIAEHAPSWSRLMEWRAVGKGKDGTSDVEGFEKEVRAGELKSAKSILTLAALREARLTRDTNGNVALDKSGTRARIDVLQSGILAVGAGYRAKLPNTGSRGQGIDSYIF